MREVGVRRMDIYLLGRQLVMVVDVHDGARHPPRVRGAPAGDRAGSQEWERLMKALQEPVAGARARRLVGDHGAGVPLCRMTGLRAGLAAAARSSRAPS